MCSRDCQLTSTKEPTRKHYAPESGLSALKWHFAGYLFVFPYDQLDCTKLLFCAKTSSSYFLFDPAQPITNCFINA